MTTSQKPQKTILNLEMVNNLNPEGCPACGNKFSLGDTVVPACGSWNGIKLIHENEAVFDAKNACYAERSYYESRR